MDENRFKNPRVFDPSRYEGDKQTSAEAAMNSDPSQRDHFVFGAGRRVCQGMRKQTLDTTLKRLEKNQVLSVASLWLEILPGGGF